MAAPEKNTIVSHRGGNRNLGIDTLRIFAMVLIVVLHVYNRGGAAAGLIDVGSWDYRLNFPLRTVCKATVDLYALISGYVMVTGRFRPARYMELWLQVFFLGVTGCILWKHALPGEPTPEMWRMAFLPVTAHEFWYFTAYTVVFLFSPLLNRGMLAMTKRQLRALMLGVFLLLSVGWVAGKMLYGDSFYLGSGYSGLWLMALYILGAGMRLSGFLERTAAWKLWLTILLSLCLIYLVRWQLSKPTLPEKIQDWASLSDAYTSPLLLVMALCIFRLFTRLQVRGIAAGLVRFFSPLTFGVYVIHVHDAVWTPLHNAFRPFSELPGYACMLAVLFAGVAIFLACALIDWLRSLLFRLLRVRTLCELAENKLKKLWQTAEQE